jgi:transcriptional regulator with XRE-family HTH domain
VRCVSEKVAQTLGAIVAANVRQWRLARGLDQQGLADRLADLGWDVDRTTIVRIEKGSRKVTVDDLGLLAVALNVPLPLLMLPVHGGDIALTPAAKTATVNRWQLWEWMLGNEPLPGRLGGEFRSGEWRSGAEPLWLYERVRISQLGLQGSNESAVLTRDQRKLYVAALQRLVDTVADMESAGLPADDLIGHEWAKAIAENGITPSPRARRYGELLEYDESRREWR